MASENEPQINSLTLWMRDAIGPPPTLLSPLPRRFAAAAESALVALDANVLLLPYSLESQGLTTIAQTYNALASAGRLLVPAQSVREFTKNRLARLADVTTEVLKAKSTQPPAQPTHPVLRASLAATEVDAKHVALVAAHEAYRAALGALDDDLQDWGVNDPVLGAYSKCLPAESILDAPGTEESLRKEYLRRLRIGVPPGFRDAGKPDAGIGDYIIWETLLEAGRARKGDLIFVTGETKSDWCHVAQGRVLFPRIELVEEYRRASDGGCFFLCPLSRLLRAINAKPDAIRAVAAAESTDASLAQEEPSCFVLCDVITTPNPTEVGGQSTMQIDVINHGLTAVSELVVDWRPDELPTVAVHSVDSPDFDVVQSTRGVRLTLRRALGTRERATARIVLNAIAPGTRAGVVEVRGIGLGGPQTISVYLPITREFYSRSRS